ncbi:MAG: radical SAM/SPASM domain-containing protein [bacterium]
MAPTFLKEFKFLFNRLPFYVIFYPTSKCNASCPHCFNYQRQQEASLKEELSLDEIEKISKNFGHIKVLVISGGEPFLRDDLAEIVSVFYKNNRIQYISFHTNAFLTKKVVDTVGNVLDKFKDLGVIVCISIDGIKDGHDRFRGVKGGFDKILETIDGLKKLKDKFKNLNLITSTIFSHSTIDSFADTIRFIQNNIGSVKPSLAFIRGDVKDKEEKVIDYIRYRDFYRNFKYQVDNNISPFSSLALKEALEMVVNKIVVDNYVDKKQTVPCQAGRKLLVIYENGDVYPCEILGHKLGNLRQANYDIKQILFSQRNRTVIENISQNKKCYCTWENVTALNLLYSPKFYPMIIREWFRLFVMKTRQAVKR